jgi:hypothetical protein
MKDAGRVRLFSRDRPRVPDLPENPTAPNARLWNAARAKTFPAMSDADQKISLGYYSLSLVAAVYGPPLKPEE